MACPWIRRQHGAYGVFMVGEGVIIGLVTPCAEVHKTRYIYILEKAASSTVPPPAVGSGVGSTVSIGDSSSFIILTPQTVYKSKASIRNIITIFLYLHISFYYYVLRITTKRTSPFPTT
jgi:hypothetical protein